MRRQVLLELVLVVTLIGLLEPSAGATAGARAWVRRYNDRFNDQDGAKAVKVSPDSLRVYVTGTSWQGEIRKRDYVTIAYSRGGATLWMRRFNGSNGDDRARALALSPDGTRLFVTGLSYGGSAARADFATVAYSSSGTTLWVSRYDGPSHKGDGATSIAVSADGTRLYVTGWSFGPATTDYVTVAYDAATGGQVWVQRYDSGGPDRAFSVAVSRDGTRVYVTGGAPYCSCLPPYLPSSLTTVAYDAVTGSQLWAQQFGAGDDASEGVLAVTRDGTRVYVTGTLFSEVDKYQAVTIAYDNNGTQLWERHVTGIARALGVNRYGTRLYVSGTNLNGLFTLAYSSAGNRLWKRTYPGGFCGEPAGLVVSGNGARIYLTGSPVSCYYSGHFTTIAYSSTGTQLWARRYIGPGNGNDLPSGIALSPDQTRLYVTGISWGGSLTHYDYATIAYKTT